MSFHWADGVGAEKSEPTEAKKLIGFIDEEFPDHNHFNWLFNQATLLVTAPYYILEPELSNLQDQFDQINEGKFKIKGHKVSETPDFKLLQDF